VGGKFVDDGRGGALFMWFFGCHAFFFGPGKKTEKKNTPCNSTGPLNLILFCKNKDGIEIKNEKGHLVLSFSRWNNELLEKRVPRATRTLRGRFRGHLFFGTTQGCRYLSSVQACGRCFTGRIWVLDPKKKQIS